MDRYQQWYTLNAGYDSEDETDDEMENVTLNIEDILQLLTHRAQFARVAHQSQRSEQAQRHEEVARLHAREWQARMRGCDDLITDICSHCDLASPYADRPAAGSETASVGADAQDAMDVAEEAQEEPRHAPVPALGVADRLLRREQGLHSTPRDRIGLTSQLMPRNHVGRMDHFHRPVFCGTFSPTGSAYMAACQDGTIRLYDARRNFRLAKQIQADDVGWSIIDTDYSPDQQFIIYSTWSNFVHLWTATETEGEDLHLELDFSPPESHFCLFSIKFSHDSAEIVGGGSDHCIYVYDVGRRERVLRISGHRQDVNAVAFADASSNLIISGSDDALCKVDRRALAGGQPVGVLAGHHEGITYIDPKGDGRYFISNGKDQTVRLWDMRKMGGPRTRPILSSRMSDYRYGPIITPEGRRRQDDHSLMVYKGHMVYRTLIRARWSPAETTGQRYIYAGGGNGKVLVWDVLTGECVQELLHPHPELVRDVAWHPHEPTLLTATWSGNVEMFSV